MAPEDGAADCPKHRDNPEATAYSRFILDSGLKPHNA